MYEIDVVLDKVFKLLHHIEIESRKTLIVVKCGLVDFLQEDVKSN